MAKDLGDRNGEGKAYCNLGNLYHIIGAYKQAEMFHRDHLSIAKELGDRIGEGNAYGNLGIVYNSLADFEQAIACHEKHLRVAKEMEDRTGEGRVYCCPSPGSDVPSRLWSVRCREVLGSICFNW